MDGRRFSACLFSGLLVGAFGCTRTTYPDTPGMPKPVQPGLFGAKTPAGPPSASASNMPKDPMAFNPTRKKGPLAAETEVQFANTHVDVALGDPPPPNRDELLDLARVRYQRALKQEPKHKGALLGLARMHARLGDRERAIDAYKKYVEYYPKEADVLHEIAMRQGQWKDWPGALASCTAARKLDPDNRAYTKTYGFCLARAGKWDEAYAALSKLMPEAQARHNLAGMLDHMGEAAACRQQLMLALQADPSYVAAREFLAELDEATLPALPGVEAHPIKQAGHTEPQ